MFLTGYRNRLGAILTWWPAFTRDVRRERAFTTQQVATMHDVYTQPLGPVGSTASVIGARWGPGLGGLRAACRGTRLGAG